MGQQHSSVFTGTVLHDALHALALTGVSAHGPSHAGSAPATIVAATLVPACAAAALLICDHHRQAQQRADEAALAAYQELAAEVALATAAMRVEMANLTEHGHALEQLLLDVG